jgi:hypothetical protein
MTRRQWLILAAILAVALFIVWLARSSRQAPLLPEDETHRTFDGASSCLACHAPGAAVPQSPRHPLGDDCLRCHGQR